VTDVALVSLPVSWRVPVPEWALGHRYLAAALRAAGFDARLVFAPLVLDGTARSRLVADLVRSAPAVVAFTTYDAGLPDLYSFVGELREAGLRSHVTVGGLCATAATAAILTSCPGVDSVVRGEGEQAVVDLVDAVVRGRGPWPAAGTAVRAGTGAGVLAGPTRPPAADLGSYPAPLWDDGAADERSAAVAAANGCAPVIGSRGCYGRCTFCCIERFYRDVPHSRPWRPWPAERVADDVVAVVAATGASQVTFVDENFVGPGRAGRRHAVAVADELVRRGRPAPFNVAARADDVDVETFRALRDAGLNAVTLGLESMSATTLELFGKHITPARNAEAVATLEELGLQTEITFIFFHPLSTLPDVRDNLGFVADVARSRGARFNNGQPFTRFVPLAGTALTADLERRGLVQGGPGRYRTRYADPRVAHLVDLVARVPVDDLLALQAALPTTRGPVLTEIRERLAGYHARLTMRRLPELVSDACDAFERGAAVDGASVAAVDAAFDAEATSVEGLLRRFLRHAA
jgi:radical SAM superfamily enzyme YgiQ (UPF0313 family)